MLSAVLLVVMSYLAGSIPFGWMAARFVKGIDLRTVGSGNIGATNTSRLLGPVWGIIILALDALKGLVPTLCGPWMVEAASPWHPHAAVLAGTCAIVGHMYPVWLRFQGGKGVATALGVIAVLSPWGTLVAFAAFAVSFVATRIVSLGSVLAATSFGVYQAVMLQPYTRDRWSLLAFSIAVPLLIVYRHRSNIQRLLHGEERALQTKATAEPH